MTEETQTDQDEQTWSAHIDDALILGNQPTPDAADIAIQGAARRVVEGRTPAQAAGGNVLPFKSSGESLSEAKRNQLKKYGLRALIVVGVVIAAGVGIDHLLPVQAPNGTPSSVSEATPQVLQEIKDASSHYSPNEQLVGTFTIDAENPNVSQGIDSVIKAHPAEAKIDPADINFSRFTALQSAADVEGDDNSVNPGEKFQVVKEPIKDAEGDVKEVIIVEPALPPALTLDSTDKIPVPTSPPANHNDPTPPPNH